MIKHIPYPRLLDFYMRFRIRTVASVIDVGAGIRPMSWFVPTTHIVIEPHAEYIDRLHQTHPHIIAWHTTAQEALPTVQDGAVDSVFIMDCLEHISKDDGYIILRNANRIAREQVVVFTPIGFFPQPESEVDGWGLHGGVWQVHRSGWTPDELASFEFDCYTCQTYHSVDAHGTRLARPVGAFYAVRDVSSTTTG